MMTDTNDDIPVKAVFERKFFDGLDLTKEDLERIMAGRNSYELSDIVLERHFKRS